MTTGNIPLLFLQTGFCFFSAKYHFVDSFKENERHIDSLVALSGSEIS